MTDEFVDIEHAVYEAAIIPEFWPKVLEELGKITGTAGGAFVTMNERGTHIVCAPILDRAKQKILSEGYMSRSGRANGVIAKGLVGVPRFLNEYDYYESLADADNDPIVAEVFRESGMGWAAGWIQQLPHEDTIVMNVEQFRERGPIEGASLAKLDLLYPTLARATMFAARAGVERVRTAIDTLTAVGLPAAALSPTGRVIVANEGFTSATHLWTTRGGDKLALYDLVAQLMLVDALSARGGIRAPGSIPLRKEAGGNIAAVLQIVPIRRNAHDIFGSADVIVVLSEARDDQFNGRLIQSLFDLTPAELEIATKISAGMSVTQIAVESRRSVITIRNQLKSAMTKAGVSRQVELALLIRQLRSISAP